MNETRMRELESLLSEAFADEEFVTALFALDTAEEAQAMLKDKGIEMTLDEVKRLPDAMAMARTGEGELSEDDLEDVAGGSIWPWLISVTVPIGPIFPGPIRWKK